MFVSGPDSNCFVFFGGFFFLGFVSRQSQRRLWRLPIINSRLPLHYSKKKTLVSRSLSLCKPNNNNNNNSNKKKKGKKKNKTKIHHRHHQEWRKGDSSREDRVSLLFPLLLFLSLSISVLFSFLSRSGIFTIRGPGKKNFFFFFFFIVFLVVLLLLLLLLLGRDQKKKKERKKEKKRKEERRYGATCSEINDSVGASLSRPATNANRHPLST